MTLGVTLLDEGLLRRQEFGRYNQTGMQIGQYVECRTGGID